MVNSPIIDTIASDASELDEGSFVFSQLVLTPRGSMRLGEIHALNSVKSSLPLIGFEVLGIVLCGMLTVAAGELLVPSWSLQLSLFQYGLLALTLVSCYIVRGLYPACGMGQLDEFKRIISAVGIVFMGLLGGLAFAGAPWNTLVGCGLLGILSAFVMPSVRLFGRSILARFNWWCQPVLVVGQSDVSLDLYRRLQRSRREGLRPLGIAFDPYRHWTDESSREEVYVGPVTEIESILLTNRTTRVAVPSALDQSKVSFHHFFGIPEVVLSTDLKSIPTESARIADRQGRVEIHCEDLIYRISSRTAKRAMDLALILLFSPLLVPILALCALMVRLSSAGPVFYSQERIGRGGRRFRAWKFRSMVLDADKVLTHHLAAKPELKAEWDRDHKLKNDPRITRAGKWLRKSSLDELPQIWNVFVGEMSLVGPRPIVEKEIKKYGRVFEMYQLVKPGITGLWQVSGRNNTTYDERLNFDRYYVQNWSCLLDIFILMRTIKTALFQEGAY